MQFRDRCRYIPCIMRLPAHGKLLIYLHKQKKGRSGGWQGMARAEPCHARSRQPWAEQTRSLVLVGAGGAAALAASGFGWRGLASSTGGCRTRQKDAPLLLFGILENRGQMEGEMAPAFDVLRAAKIREQNIWASFGEGQSLSSAWHRAPRPWGMAQNRRG